MNKLTAALALLIGLGSLASTQSLANTTESLQLENAKVIFVRGKESSKTRSLNYNVYLGDTTVGRMKVKDRKIVEVPAGEYVVQTNFYNSDSLPVSLEAGKTYTISTTMESRSNTKTARFQLLNSAENKSPAADGS